MAPEDPVQLDHERRIRRLEEARHDMEETLIVIGEIERRQSALLREHSELIVRIEHNLGEITDKLNGLIGWADSSVQRPPGDPQGPKQQ
jgi:hypothetical protein